MSVWFCRLTMHPLLYIQTFTLVCYHACPKSDAGTAENDLRTLRHRIERNRMGDQPHFHRHSGFVVVLIYWHEKHKGKQRVHGKMKKSKYLLKHVGYWFKVVCLFMHVLKCTSSHEFKASGLELWRLRKSIATATQSLVRAGHILTHWGRVAHICVSKLTIITSDNDLPPGRRQAIIWTNAGILLIGPLGTIISEISIEI